MVQINLFRLILIIPSHTITNLCKWFQLIRHNWLGSNQSAMTSFNRSVPTICHQSVPTVVNKVSQTVTNIHKSFRSICPTLSQIFINDYTQSFHTGSWSICNDWMTSSWPDWLTLIHPDWIQFVYPIYIQSRCPDCGQSICPEYS